MAERIYDLNDRGGCATAVITLSDKTFRLETSQDGVDGDAVFPQAGGAVKRAAQMVFAAAFRRFPGLHISPVCHDFVYDGPMLRGISLGFDGPFGIAEARIHQAHGGKGGQDELHRLPAVAEGRADILRDQAAEHENGHDYGKDERDLDKIFEGFFFGYSFPFLNVLV